MGISSVHGNAPLKATTGAFPLPRPVPAPAARSVPTVNCARCLLSFGSAEQAELIPIYEGASKPLILEAKHDDGSFSSLSLSPPYLPLGLP